MPKERPMATSTDHPLDTFVWTPQPDAARFVDQLVESLSAVCPPAARLARRLLDETGTRLVDWIDHLGLKESAANERQLRELGFEPAAVDGHEQWRHPEALFPTIHFYRQADSGLAIKVESVTDFLLAQGLEGTAIEGPPLAALRKRGCSARTRPNCGWWNGTATAGLKPLPVPADTLRAVLEHGEAFRRRARHFDTEERGFDHARQLIARAIGELGVNRTCDLFFAAEREYWQRRNRAGQVQKARQDALGLGWANHDHHTYRSSRAHFPRLIAHFRAVGLSMPRAILWRPRRGLGSSGRRTDGLRNRDVCRRRPDAAKR